MQEKEGHKSVEVVIAKYEAKPPLVSKEYHHNIVLLAGEIEARVYDLTSKSNPDENDHLALTRANTLLDRLKINGLGVSAVQLKPAKYNWWWDKIIFNQASK